ncbi:IS200/IS605 family element RNA-guided endonuclease TnpB [Klebsiella phage phiKp_32]|nr:IS200/IS605 family element RNA-guided endonuclease TnpB [Klebsiella phage phiKp_32]
MFISKRGKLRLYKEDVELVNRTFGCRRFVWNQLLGLHKERYEKWKENNNLEKPTVSISALREDFKRIRSEHSWLNEVSSVALYETITDLYNAFQRFFNNQSGYPKFKSKRGAQTFRITSRVNLRVEGNMVRLPKSNCYSIFSKNTVLNDPSSYTVTRDSVGDYFISFVDQIDEIEPEPESKGKHVGIDLGIKSLAIVKPSKGEPWELINPRTYTKYQKRRTTLQRRLMKKKKGSKNRNKARIKLAKLERKVANIRKDLLHKFTTTLIKENQMISIEDLNVKGMLKNHSLAKHIQDCSFGTIRTMLEYKAKRYTRNKTITIVNRFFASTQLCSQCGVLPKERIGLKIRNWVCWNCGTKHDRDINAATNILNQGLRLTTS